MAALEFREVLGALRSSWWAPVGALVVGLLAALGASWAQQPIYTASSQLFVSTTNNVSSVDLSQGSQFSEQRVTSYAELITGRELAARVATRLGLSLTPSELSREITATPVPGTVLIDISVQDPSAERARRIANAVGDEFTAYASELETSGANGVSPVKVTVTESAALPSAPSSPRTVRNGLVGAILGLLIGATVAVLRSKLDRSVKAPNEIRQLADAPLIAAIVRDESLRKGHTIDAVGSGRVAEDYRQLRLNLQYLNVDDPPTVIMVSSAVPSEGKTTVVINLAMALAEAGRQVTIVEGDLRRPRVTRYLGMVSGVGLTNILASAAEASEVAQSYGDGGFSVIGAGPTPPNPGQLLASGRMAALIDELREKNDYVLIDAPPLLPVADSTALAVMADGVLLSVRYGKSRKEQLRQAAETLERVGARTLGVILNIVPPKAESAGAYGYGYTYDSDSDGGRGSHRRDE